MPSRTPPPSFRMLLKLPAVLLAIALVAGCGDDDSGNDNQNQRQPVDPSTASRAPVDRFSPQVATLFVRTAENGLPAANAPVDFDQPPFITRGLGPAGERIRYYNFDVWPTTPAILYQVYREGEDTPVAGQLPIINVIPGDEGYSDFWRIYKVIAPPGYVANTVTSFDGVYEENFGFEATDEVRNCPVVPEGSTASLRLPQQAPASTLAWYRDQVVTLLTFAEAPLAVNVDGQLPTAPIHVCFNIAPGQPGGGPPSGVCTEPGTDQTHNVASVLPGEADYSPLWDVRVYDASAFAAVSDLATAEAATTLVAHMALVNCPVVEIQR